MLQKLHPSPRNNDWRPIDPGFVAGVIPALQSRVALFLPSQNMSTIQDRPFIPLSSDTESKPTAAMRVAIATAEVGDEQRGEDPTVNGLQDRVAELLGKEAALWFPGGTMCNFVAIKVHRPRTRSVFLARYSVIIALPGCLPGMP